MDVVLRGDAVNELLRMELLRMDGGSDERAHERLHNLVTAQFHVEHRLGVVNLLIGCAHTALISLPLWLRDMLDKAPLKSTVEDFFLVLDEGLHTRMLKLAHGTRPEIHHLLILIRHPVLL